MMWCAALVASACGNSLHTKTRAYVATEACGQGPFDVVIRADATTGGEGMEVIACTPRRLAGYVELRAGALPLASRAFGDVADNQRCLGGRPVAVTEAASATSSTAQASGGAGGVRATSPNLVERPFTDSETPFADELCKPYGLTAQTLLGVTTMARPDDTWLKRGDTLQLRIWSEAPNDLEGVVFMVRHVTSSQSMAEAAKEQQEWEKKWDREEREGKHAKAAPRTSPRERYVAPPPPPLAEQRPSAPSATATWVAGYWVRTGERWGWIAGFWRDEGNALPAPQVEIPGAPPHDGAVWIGGTWTLRAGAHVWIRGRWR